MTAGENYYCPHYYLCSCMGTPKHGLRGLLSSVFLHSKNANLTICKLVFRVVSVSFYLSDVGHDGG